MRKNDVFISLYLFFIAISIRFPFVEHMQSHWDGPQYSIAIIRYSLLQQTPAFPGYPLYIFCGWVLNFFFHDPHTSLIVFSLIASGLTAGVLYLCTARMFSRVSGIITAGTFLTAPAFYFFGLTAYPYGLLPFFSMVMGFLCFSMLFRKKEWSFYLGAFYAIIIGYRPQEFLFFLPLVIYTAYNWKFSQKKRLFLSFFLTLLLWFIPFFIIAGGTNELSRFFPNLLHPIDARLPFFQDLSRNWFRILRGVFLSSGCLLAFVIAGLYSKWVKKNIFDKFIKRKEVNFFTLWIIPGFLFNLFVRTDHAGHQMSFLTPVVVFSSYILSKTISSSRTLIVIIVFLFLFNILWFFKDRDPKYVHEYIPTSFHYSEIRKNDIRLKIRLDYIKNHLNPSSIILIASSQLWRPIMYYLPEYSVIDPEGIFSNDPFYNRTLRSGKNWMMTENANVSFTLNIPEGVTGLLFVDSGTSQYIKNSKKLVIQLPYHVDMALLKVHSFERYLYKYHTFAQL